MAESWISYFNSLNTRYGRDLADNTALEVAEMSAQLTRNFMMCLRDLTSDEASRTAVTEAAAHGMLHQVAQELLFTRPPSFAPPEGTVN